MEDRKNIVKTVYDYLCLKKECMDRGFEDLFDVIDIFVIEVIELKEVCFYVDEVIGDR